jgi:hypothetical protein
MKRQKNNIIKQSKNENKLVEAQKIDWDNAPPLFSLHLIQKNYCITDCQQEDKARFAESLRKLSMLTWRDLKRAGRHKLGCEKIPKNAIKAPIPSSISEDTCFLAFRFCELKPMVGYRENSIFHILWLDHDRNLYDHG